MSSELETEETPLNVRALPDAVILQLCAAPLEDFRRMIKELTELQKNGG